MWIERISLQSEGGRGARVALWGRVSVMMRGATCTTQPYSSLPAQAQAPVSGRWGALGWWCLASRPSEGPQPRVASLPGALLQVAALGPGLVVAMLSADLRYNLCDVRCLHYPYCLHCPYCPYCPHWPYCCRGWPLLHPSHALPSPPSRGLPPGTPPGSLPSTHPLAYPLPAPLHIDRLCPAASCPGLTAATWGERQKEASREPHSCPSLSHADADHDVAFPPCCVETNPNCI